MVRWIQMIFGIQQNHEEMQVNFEYGCDPSIIEGVIVSIHFLSDGLMDSKDVWYTDVS
jgi:hypothetical protein